MVNAAYDDTSTQRLYIADRISGRTYLIDTGATVSCLPATAQDKLNAPTGSLSAINTSGIRTWGTRSKSIQLSGGQFDHKFHICEVSKPLLGADFFQPPQHGHRLQDPVPDLHGW